MIAPYWDYIVDDAGSNGGVYTKEVGTSPNRKFIIEWESILEMAYNKNLITGKDITSRKDIPSLYSGTQQVQICEVNYP